jgi:hypothetical protein
MVPEIFPQAGTWQRLIPLISFAGPPPMMDVSAMTERHWRTGRIPYRMTADFNPDL